MRSAKRRAFAERKTTLGEAILSQFLSGVGGGGTYKQLMPSTQELLLFRAVWRVVTLEHSMRLKHTARRPKDLEAIAELQALLEERREIGPAS